MRITDPRQFAMNDEYFLLLSLNKVHTIQHTKNFMIAFQSYSKVGP
jgi:hypothetical protein